MLNRVGRLLAVGCTSIVGGLVACGSSGSSSVGATTATNATVTIDMYDSSGNQSGTCAGTVVAPDTVLTSGHCVVGKSVWQITLPSTGQVVHSSLGYTYDWEDFQSSFSHPLHRDLAVLKLDTMIYLPSYPQLATSPLADGTGAMRIHAGSTGFEAVGTVVYDGATLGFSEYYYTSIPASEALLTGAGLIDPVTGTLFGVVSGRGMTTGYLYVSRAEVVSDWLGAKVECSPAWTSTSLQNYVVGPDCHPSPPKCDGGTSSSGGSSSSSSSGGGSNSGSGSSSGGPPITSSSGGSGSSSGGPPITSSSGGSGSSSGGALTEDGGSGGSCNGGGGWCYGSSCPTPGCPGGGGSGSGGSGGNGGQSSGGNPPITSSGGGSGGGAGSTSSGSGGHSSGGNPPSGSGSGGSGSGGWGGTSSGSGGSSGSGSGGGQSSGSNPPTTSSGSGSGSSSGGSVSSGGNPPTTNGNGSGTGDTGCTGSDCGGCGDLPNCSDGSEDFGNCGCSTPPVVTPPPVK